ncbi:MAG: hypothetical protein ACJ8M4_02810 [Chthoniobacterales bacterium]
MRIRLFHLLFLLFAAAPTALPADFDEEKPHGRAALSIFEPGPPEKEEVFQASIAPAPGKTVRVYVDASDKCSVLVAAMTRDGKLANGWRPQLSEVPEEFEEILLPKPPMKWDWTTPSVPFDVYVLFLPPGSAEIENARKLVDAMQNPKTDGRVLALQTGKLKELIGRLATDKSKNAAPASAPEVGGVFRGAAFPWRQFAQGVNFSPDQPGVLIVSSDNADKK